VCEKVEQKRTTTYNEVADELVLELRNEKEGYVDEVYAHCDDRHELIPHRRISEGEFTMR